MKLDEIKVKPDVSVADDIEVEFTSTCRSMVHAFFNKEWQKTRINMSMLRQMIDDFEKSLDIIEANYNDNLNQ